MGKVTLTIEVDPELRRRVKLAARSRGETMREWIVRAIERGLEREINGELIAGQPRENPLGLKNPPRPRSGRSVSDTVIEERRSGW